MTGPDTTRLLLAALLLAQLCGCPRDRQQQGPTSLLGRAAPEFALESLTRRRFYLGRQQREPTLLLFWDTSCKVCVRLMVDLERLRVKLGTSRVAMAAVCTDPQNLDEVRRISGGLGLGYAVLLDRGARVARSYRVRAHPTVVLISPAGKVLLVREGYSRPLLGQLRDAIEGLR